MGKEIRQDKYREYALEIIEMLTKSAERLKYSYSKVQKIDLDKEDFTEEELETIESLCSRFARISDILLQKAFRFLDIYEFDGYDFPVPKRITLAERRKLIPSTETFKYIRELRNEVAHNYATDYYIDLFKEIFKYTPTLFEIVDNTIEYLNKKFQRN
ncbi:hypothetical protein D9V87_03285 [Bacteroidetes/Chlorobi group bacterium MS-B_bin-24]|nr:MAG: hypothetical protein D9V87_03285 [Bacteroidetes/Chlorobi group bacterium MS-B_bin-24]